MRIVFTETGWYGEVEIPSKEEVRNTNLSKMYLKRFGFEKWYKKKFNQKYFPPACKKFYKLNHTSAGISKQEFDNFILKITKQINTHKLLNKFQKNFYLKLKVLN